MGCVLVVVWCTPGCVGEQSNAERVAHLTATMVCSTAPHCLPYRRRTAGLQASLAAGMVDAVLIPEVSFTLEGEGGLLAYLEKIMEDKVCGRGGGGLP